MDLNVRGNGEKIELSPEDRVVPAGPHCVRRFRISISLVGLAVLVLLASVWWGWRSRTQEYQKAAGPPEELENDPRLAYTGPFHNIHPNVHYIGDGQCAACHEDKARTFRQHPIGRSLVPIAQLASQEPYDAGHNNPFDAMQSQFRVERKGDRIWHLRALLDGAGKPIVEYGSEVHYAIGSGTRGYSYVTDQDGYLFQTSISWYSQKQTWDLSPGFELQ